MRIRRATSSDVPALAALNRVVHAMHAAAQPGIFRPDPQIEVVVDAFRKGIDQPSSFWLLAEHEEPIAFLNAEFRERDETWCALARRLCYLGGIVVAPHWRRKGIARDLLAALKAEASSRGIGRIELDVWAFNKEAMEAYAHLGFHPVMERMGLTFKTQET